MTFRPIDPALRWLLMMPGVLLPIAVIPLVIPMSAIDEQLWRNALQPICHSIENRCLLIGDEHTLLCARCTGIYIMAAILLIIGRVPKWSPQVWLLLFPMTIDKTLEMLTGISLNLFRLISGAALGLFFLSGIAFLRDRFISKRSASHAYLTEDTSPASTTHPPPAE